MDVFERTVVLGGVAVSAATLILAASLAAIFLLCGFGMYKAMEHAGTRSDRCQEIRGYRVSGKYNGSLCRVNGVIVDVDYDDYLQQAENARSER